MIVKLSQKQHSGQGCLPACLAQLYNLPFSRQSEARVLVGGLFKQRDSYVLGICQVFVQKHSQINGLQLIVGNKPYYNHLVTLNGSEPISIEFQPASRNWLASCRPPCIIAIDRWVLGAYYHAPHYMLLIAQNEQWFWVFDPWTGQVKRRAKTTIEKGIKMLQNHLKFAPVCIQKLI